MNIRLLILTVSMNLLFSVANAKVIDFEGTSGDGCQAVLGGVADGFTLSPSDGSFGGGGFNNVADCSFAIPTANSGDEFMINYNLQYGEFTRDVGTFDLLSLYIHADATDGDTVVLLQGLDGIEGNVLYSMEVNAKADRWSLVTFEDWLNVKTFTWDPLTPDTSSNVAIDDFEYRAADVSVPALWLPFAVFVMAGGLFRSNPKGVSASLYRALSHRSNCFREKV